MVTVVAVTCCINLSRSLNHTTYMEVLVSEPSFSRAKQQQTTFVWMFLYFPYVCVYVVFMCVCLYLGACTRAGMCVWRPPWLSTLYTKVKSFNESQSCCLRESCCLLGSLLLSPTVCDERGASHPAGLCMGSGDAKSPHACLTSSLRVQPPPRHWFLAFKTQVHFALL